MAVARSSYRGVLTDPGLGFGLAWIPSLLLHVGLVLMLAFGNFGEKPRPPITREIFMVSAVVLPKAKALPKKAAAPKQPTPGEAGTKPEPPPRPDELVLKEKKAPEAEGPKIEPKEDPPKPEPTPKKRDLSALVAAVEEEADEVVFETSPEGSEDADPSQALKARFGKQLSAYERLVGDAIKANWHPTSMRMPVPDELWAVVAFSIEENGALTGPSVEQSSGDWSYDSSCLRAVTQTRRVRPPGPKDNRTVMLSFQPKDVR